MNNFDFLKHLCKIGWEKKIFPLSVDKQKYLDRLNYELEIIKKLNFVDYFLILYDIVSFAREQNIRTGVGRGSAAGSLVSYLLGITKIDPLKFNLSFVRFLNEERVNMPDIDIDFQSSRRQEVLDYIVDRFGKDRVVNVITFNVLNLKGALRDVARVLKIPLQEVNKLCSVIDEQGIQSFDVLLNSKNFLFREYYKKYPLWFKLAEKFIGVMKNISKHPAGVVITPMFFIDNLSVCTDKEGRFVTQWDKDDIEKLGFLKVDILGLLELDLIDRVLKMLDKVDFDIDNLDLNRYEVYNSIAGGNTFGIFQLGTYLNQKVVERICPENFSQLTDCIAIGRPGAILGLDVYVQGKTTGKVYYFDEKIKDVLLKTYGCIIYQEQIIEIVSRLAGFSMNKADIVRKAIAKQGDLDPLKQDFVVGCCSNGVSEKVALEVFDILQQAENYSFNFSHATCYAYIAYQTMWLKYYYPRHFICALYNCFLDDEDKLRKIDEERKRLKIKLLPLDINKSQREFALEGDAIRVGLDFVKGLSKNAISEIISKRDYRSFKEFCQKVDKRILRFVPVLIEKGVFDSLFECKIVDRNFILKEFNEILNTLKNTKTNKSICSNQQIFDLQGFF